MYLETVYIPVDAPQCDASDVPRLRSVLGDIRANAAERWAQVRADPMPAYRLWVTACDEGVAFGYRRRDGTRWSECPAREFVRAAITWALRHFSIGLQPRDEVRVFLDQRVAHLPCGSRECAGFLEDVWRQTGADVPGEEADYACACGATHRIALLE